jgi:hypothetical protein
MRFLFAQNGLICEKIVRVSLGASWTYDADKVSEQEIVGHEKTNRMFAERVRVARASPLSFGSFALPLALLIISRVFAALLAVFLTPDTHGRSLILLSETQDRFRLSIKPGHDANAGRSLRVARELEPDGRPPFMRKKVVLQTK